ncbi:MAG: L-2-amino-thiazoline-4-carboxylic acid hydrolase [Atopobiaceae bacterium]
MQYGMTPRLVWHILEKDLKAELARRYGADDAASIMKTAQVRFRQIVGGIEDPRQGRRYFWTLLQASLIASVYLAIRAEDEELSPAPEECAALFADVLARSSACQKVAQQLRNDFSIQGQRDIQRSALLTQMRCGDYGWRYVYTSGSEKDYMVTYRSCGIFRLYQELGVPELMRAACRMPDVWADLAGIHLERTMCLADGDPCCDFSLTLEEAPASDKESESADSAE